MWQLMMSLLTFIIFGALERVCSQVGEY